MTVRRIGVTKSEGYGSFGRSITTPNSIYKFDMRKEAELFNFYYEKPEGDQAPIVGVISRVYLRWKFSSLLINADILKSYNNITGKSKLGTVITKHYGYVTSESFVSFPNQMSCTYATAIKSLVFGDMHEIDDFTPCDEPPSDAQLDIIEDASWVAANWTGGSIAFSAGIASNVVTDLCDSIEFYPEEALQAYIFGGSYYFVNSAFPANQPLFNGSVIVNM